MDIKNYKKGKYEQVAEILEKEGYLSDSNAFKIWGDESGIYKALEHIRIWRKFKQDQNYFADKKIIEKKKGHRCHLVRTSEMLDGQFYKVGKEFFNSISVDNSMTNEQQI